jgi:hypothetical protein
MRATNEVTEDVDELDEAPEDPRLGLALLVRLEKHVVAAESSWLVDVGERWFTGRLSAGVGRRARTGEPALFRLPLVDLVPM